MSDTLLPLIVEPDELEAHLQDKDLLIIDLCKDETYLQSHIPGAIHIQYPVILHVEKPVMGLLPDIDTLQQIFSAIGLHEDSHVVAYDDEGGGKASRLLWTLDTIGHKHFSLLNGGLHSWANEGHPLDNQPVQTAPSQYTISGFERGIADKDYILDKLSDDTVTLLDNRSAEEFSGAKKFAAHGGHIPGAIHFDWMLTMNQSRNLRLLPDQQLKQMLQDVNVTPEQEIILYCQTHHRSSHTYIVLKHLGYENIKGYPGAWSEWGNLEGLPVES